MDDNQKETRFEPLFTAKGITKGYRRGQIEILRDLDFELNAGETVAIVGASGIGKSTFLHIMGTLDRPDTGTLYFKNQDVFKFNDEQLAKFRNETIGFVFQFHHLLPEFTALENAMMPLLIKGINASAGKETAAKILERVGLKDRLHHRIGELSGGEQQRVALARALVLNPLILLADEPTGNLDIVTSAQVHDLIMELNREMKMALIVVTHNVELASYMTRRMTIFEGKLRNADCRN